MEEKTDEITKTIRYDRDSIDHHIVGDYAKYGKGLLNGTYCVITKIEIEIDGAGRCLTKITGRPISKNP